ncbi:hypothetical protein ACP4OV_013074 [Aristida adscensionis]
MGRFVLCLAAAFCCCLALLVPAVQGRVATGFRGGSPGYVLSERRLHFTETKDAQRGVAMKKARSSWSSSSSPPAATAAAAGWVRPELRSVPDGPDPLHHHGSPRRPEQDRATP